MLKAVKLTDGLRARLRIYRAARQFDRETNNGCGCSDIAMFELAEEFLEALKEQQIAHAARLLRLPERAVVTPVVEVTLRPKRSRRG